jgi:hypothetical protein
MHSRYLTHSSRVDYGNYVAQMRESPIHTAIAVSVVPWFLASITTIIHGDFSEGGDDTAQQLAGAHDEA